MKPLILLFLSSFLLTGPTGMGQEDSRYLFVVVDTITIESPIVFSFYKYDGKFITSEVDFLNSKDKVDLIKSGDALLYSGWDFYRYLSIENLSKYDYGFPEECIMLKKWVDGKKQYHSSFETPPRRFIVCLINGLYYNKISSSIDIGKTYYHKSNKDEYYKIVFPLCE
jgi:hypothetical protein